METESTTPSLPVQTLEYPWRIFTQNLIENISSGAGDVDGVDGP